MKIVLLEKDARIAALISGWLHSGGHEPLVCHSTAAFFDQAARETCDLLVADTCSDELGDAGHASDASDESAELLMQRISASISPVPPVLLISERGHEQDIVAALKAGADDYMVKPLRQHEFLARVEAIGRRRSSALKRSDMLMFGDLCVDLQNRTILRDGRRLPLTPKSYHLAVFLFSNLGKLLLRSELMAGVWGDASGMGSRTLDTHISRLRTVLGLTPKNGWLLQSIYQYGYRLEQTVSRVSHSQIHAQEEALVC